MTRERSLFLALPRRPGFTPRGEDERHIRAVRSTQAKVKACQSNLSLLDLAFSCLWTKALNCRDTEALTNFGMQHDDIVPAALWADAHMDAIDRFGAQVVSAVVPIKDERGLTSTGSRNIKTGVVRRLTMTEVFALPGTFGIEDIRKAGMSVDGDRADVCLAINTGLWTCRFDEPWIEPPFFPGFKSQTTIGKRDDGKFVALALPEDWFFSEWLFRSGLTAMATRKTKLGHWNAPGDWEKAPDGKRREWRNDHVWGTWKTDLGDEPKV